MFSRVTHKKKTQMRVHHPLRVLAVHNSIHETSKRQGKLTCMSAMFSKELLTPDFTVTGTGLILWTACASLNNFSVFIGNSVLVKLARESRLLLEDDLFGADRPHASFKLSTKDVTCEP